MAALKQWKFKPAQQDEKPIEVQALFEFLSNLS
jgi:hypothetical protein